MDPMPAAPPAVHSTHPAVARVLAANPNYPRGVWFPASFRDHPKIHRLSDAAFRLWATGIDYCSRQLTDGFIPREVLGGLLGRRVHKRILDELLQVIPPYGSLWEVDPAGTGFRVHDYLDWNPSRTEVMAAEEEIRGELVFDEEGRPLGWSGRAVPR